MTVQARLRLALLLVVVVLVVGATGFHYLENWNWFDGLYMTVITMTTVGYGETHPLSPIGRIFNVLLILSSVVAGGFLIGTFTQAMLELELMNVLGRRRMEREIARLTEHTIICGAGRVGRTVARELRARGRSIVVIEKDAARTQWAQDDGIPVIIGDAAHEDVLQKARIPHAAGLVAAVTSDPENLYIVLTARGMRADMPIIARASEEGATPKLIRAGATQVLSPYHFVGHRIVQLLLKPNVLDFVDTVFGGRMDMQIEEVRVDERSVLVNKSLADAQIRQRAGAMILALKRDDGSYLFNPAPEDVIRANDCLIAIGGAEHLKKLEHLASQD